MENEVSKVLLSRLLQEIKEGIYSEADRLPPEVELSQKFGVSRTVVRDSLAVLEREGFINRKQGIGTVINRPVLNVSCRMDLEKEFLEMLSDEGYYAECAWVNQKRILADENVRKKLNLVDGSEVFCVERLITADGCPAIHCTDYICVDLIKKQECNYELLKEPIFTFMESECDAFVKFDVTEMTAVGADDHLSKVFDIEKGQPLLYMDEVGYNFFAVPILHSQEYYMPGILKHTVIRKKM